MSKILCVTDYAQFQIIWNILTGAFPALTEGFYWNSGQFGKIAYQKQFKQIDHKKSWEPDTTHLIISGLYTAGGLSSVFEENYWLKKCSEKIPPIILFTDQKRQKVVDELNWYREEYGEGDRVGFNNLLHSMITRDDAEREQKLIDAVDKVLNIPELKFMEESV